MALEASDMNDGSILQLTKQTADERGNIQLSIVLPTGRTLKSEFISPDRAKEALRTWLDVVKQQAVADAKEERLAAQRRAKAIDVNEGNDKPLFRAGGARDSVKQAGIAEAAQARKEAAEIEAKHPDYGPVVHSDPLEYARAQYEYYSSLLRELRPKVEQYERFVQQWGTILDSLYQEPTFEGDSDDGN